MSGEDKAIKKTFTLSDFEITEAISLVEDITEILDIPEDQGNRVYLTFTKTYFDNQTLHRETEGYTIERRTPCAVRDSRSVHRLGGRESLGLRR